MAQARLGADKVRYRCSRQRNTVQVGDYEGWTGHEDQSRHTNAYALR
jgi:hypothetical protein